jgi:hypothetical protein
MASTTTLPDTSDTFDWRDGLVVLPEGHVYGKTALTEDEWREVARRRRREEFVLVDSGWPKPSPTRDYETAMRNYDNDVHGRTQRPGMYGPQAGRSLRVIAAMEVPR